MDDFEAFRKKQQAKKEAEKAAAEDAAKQEEAAKKMGWIDGLGPAGVNNPKVKGFVLGRFRKKKIDPTTLEKPKGFESHRLGEGVEPEDPAKKPPTPPADEAPKVKGYSRY